MVTRVVKIRLSEMVNFGLTKLFMPMFVFNLRV